MHSILFYPDINYLLEYAFVHQSEHFFILYYILQPFYFVTTYLTKNPF